MKTLVRTLGLCAIATAIFAPPALSEELRHQVSATKAVDLSHEMYEGMAYWPGGVPFTMTKLVDYPQGYLLHKFEVGENTGTHVDAPHHFIEDKDAVAQIPLRDLIVPAVVIDIRDKVAGNVDYQLTADDVRAWEAKHGEIPAGALAILNSGWHKRFGSQQDYANQDESGTMHFPGYAKDAAELLVARDVVGIGIDTLSLDYGPAKSFDTHQVMLKANKYQIENLANLDALPPTGASVVVGVLKVRGGSQAQARVIALLP